MYKKGERTLRMFLLFNITLMVMLSNGTETPDEALTTTPKSEWFIKCPKNLNDKSQGFYDGVTKRCYLAGEQGPCPQNMIWYRESPDSEDGLCGCIAHDPCKRIFNRPVALWPVDRKCYVAYEQGPCRSGEWMVFDNKGFGICKPNACDGYYQEINTTIFEQPKVQTESRLYYDNPDAPVEYEVTTGLNPWDPKQVFNFLVNGTCYKTYARGPCHEGEVYSFLGTDPYPKCSNPSKNPTCQRVATVSADLGCPNGSRKYGSDCIPITRSAFFD